MATWFHHILRLRLEATDRQRQTILEQVTVLLARYPRIQDDSIRIRLLRGDASLVEVEILAYLFARNPNHFREMQDDLQFRVLQIVQRVAVRRYLSERFRAGVPEE